ncbi:MAG: helix-turn-helix domain-containing protein [Nocardiaceae bacterium]|nr:helix-turn-helix domain-containing protein [Nocardiaceae bacterium]
MYRTRYPAAQLLGARGGYNSTNPEDVTLLFAQRLRESAGDERSQRALSNSASVSEHSLDQYLRGESTPPIDVLAKLADALDVHPAWLGGLSEDQHGEAPTETGHSC